MKNHKIISCNICKFEIHIKCNRIDDKTYEKIKIKKLTQICIKCKEDNIPFQSLNNQQLFNINEKTLDGKIMDEIKQPIFPSRSLKTFINEMNNIDNVNDNNDIPIKCDYVEPGSF